MKMINSSAIKAIIPSASRYFLVTCALFFPHAAFSMVELGDEKLSQVTGQALLQMGKTNPGEDGTDINGPTFYKAGLDAMLDINLNIEKLQLGCTSGAINGNQCDIDIDHLSLSGDCANRPDCSASLVRPFFEFAVKNDHQKTLREVTGIRLSAEQAFGLLTAGTENSGNPNGINALSGYMVAQSDSSGMVKGYARTEAAYYDAAAYPLTGKIVAIGLAEVDFKTTDGGFWIPAINDPEITNNLYFEAPGLVVNGRRLSSVSLNNGNSVFTGLPDLQLNPEYDPATGTYTPGAGVPLQTQGGPLTAEVTDCQNTVFFIPACIAAPDGREFTNVRMEGLTTGINVGITFEQALGYIHKIKVNESPFYLGFQKEAVKWPGSNAADVAQQGWWMSFSDPVDIGYVNPQDTIDLGSPEIGPDFFPQLQSAISSYITANPATSNDVGAIFTGDGMDVDAGTIDLSGSPLFLGLSDLQLSGQNFTPNCYGSAKFC